MTKRKPGDVLKKASQQLADRRRYEAIIARYLADCYASRSVARASELALRLEANRPYLSKRTVELFGKPLSEILRERQFAEAKRLLQVTNVPIDEVAAASGFGHRSTLHRRFRVAFGMTPTEFREATNCDTDPKKRSE